DARGADLCVAKLALEVLHAAVDRGVDRLLDVDGVEEMRPSLEVEAEPHRLLPRPPCGCRPHDRRDQQHDGRDGERSEQGDAIEDVPAHDFSRSFSRASSVAGFSPARSTPWIALRSTTTCTLGAISTVTVLSPSPVTR